MGLIYVNPEGPGGNPDPLESAKDIRETFRRMAMNDEETVALIVGGHTFGKCHGAVSDEFVGPEPEACPIEAQGIGWVSTSGTGKGADTITSGLEGAWTNEPTQWDNGYLDNLFNYEYELTESPAGAKQWTPTDASAQGTVPDAHDPSKKHAHDADDGPRAEDGSDLRADHQALPRASRRTRGRVREGVVQAVAPRHGAPLALPRPVGAGAAALAGPRPRRRSQAGREEGHRRPQAQNPRFGTVGLPARLHRMGVGRQLPRHRHAGGANGARIRLEPQKDWEVNEPAELAKVLKALEKIQQDFNGSASGGKQVSLADLIVLGGCAAVEQAAKDAGHKATVPFAPGRTDASQDQTDVESFEVLELTVMGSATTSPRREVPPETLLLDRANLLTLTAPR